MPHERQRSSKRSRQSIGGWLVVGDSLLDFAAQYFATGQKELAQCTKHLVSVMQNPIVELLDFSNETIFLEPTLFTLLGQKYSKVTLEQILYGYLSNPARLASFAAYADWQGLVYLPRLGHLPTETNGAILTVDSSAVACRLHEVRHICESQIELRLTGDPLLASVFQDADELDVPIEPNAANQYSCTMDRAFETLQIVAPVLFECLAAVTRRIVLFRSEKLGSFADIAAHGTAFLNVAQPEITTQVFFVEDLAHQCGHILFSAMTVNRAEYLRADPTTPLQRFTGAADERRDLYTAFHGVFTEALMCIALFSCLDAGVFSGQKLHALLGRLSFVMKRFQLDLLNLQHPELFTTRGLTVVHECGRVFDEVYRCTKDRIIRFDLSNQSYTFSYERFRALNSRLSR